MSFGKYCLARIQDSTSVSSSNGGRSLIPLQRRRSPLVSNFGFGHIAATRLPDPSGCNQPEDSHRPSPDTLPPQAGPVS
jgi:hypothetical protein